MLLYKLPVSSACDQVKSILVIEGLCYYDLASAVVPVALDVVLGVEADITNSLFG